VIADRVCHIALYRALSRKFKKWRKFSSRLKAKWRAKKKKKKKKKKEEDRRVKGDPPVFTTKLNPNIDTCFQSTSVSFSQS